MVRQHRDPTQERSTPQGEALAVWGLWGLLLVAMGVTYARVAPADLYHVSRGGLAGGCRGGGRAGCRSR